MNGNQLKCMWVDPQNPPDMRGLYFMAKSVDHLFDGEFEAKFFNEELPNEKWGEYLKYLIAKRFSNDGIVYAIGGFGFSDELLEKDINFYRNFCGEEANGTARDVYVLDVPDELISIRVGVTIHRTYGSWSSYPPHKFELDGLINPKSPYIMSFFETFAFITYPSGGWGVQARRNVVDQPSHMNTFSFMDRDIIDLDLCSHPTAAGPGYKLAYIWSYGGGRNKFVKGGGRI